MCEKFTLLPYDKMSLETSFHAFSDDKVRFKIEGGFTRNLQKCNSHSNALASSPQIIAVTRGEVIML